MSQQPRWSDVCDGLLVRAGQLRTWAERVGDRLRDIRRRSALIRSPGAKQLLSTANDQIRKALEKLNAAPARVRGSNPGDQGALRQIQLDLQSAEQLIRNVDVRLVPLLSSRTRSDPKYDHFIGRFLDGLNIHEFAPFTSHKQRGVPELSVDFTSSPGVPMFYFAPSIRSFDALSLLYHEFGHMFFGGTVDEAGELELCRQMTSFDPAAQQAGDLHPRESNIDEFSKTYTHLWSVRREILADAFGGLVGGHAYTSALCAMFLVRQCLHHPTSDRHPPPSWRVWFGRRACLSAGSPRDEDNGSLFVAWDAVLKLSPRAERGPWLLEDAQAADRVLDSLKAVLRSTEVPLAGQTRRHATDPIPKLRWGKTPIPEILLLASKYKSLVSWERYRDWERDLFPKVGLPSRPSIWKSLRNSIRPWRRR